MTDQEPRRSHHKKPAPRVPAVRSVRDTIIVENESFTALCKSLLHFSEELANISRDIAEIKLQNFQIGANQEALSGDISEIVRRMVVLEQIAQSPAPQVYRQDRQQFDHQGLPVRQLPPRPQEPTSLRDALRNVQGVRDPGFIPPTPNDNERGRR